jgi:hypothetical protein
MSLCYTWIQLRISLFRLILCEWIKGGSGLCRLVYILSLFRIRDISRWHVHKPLNDGVFILEHGFVCSAWGVPDQEFNEKSHVWIDIVDLCCTYDFAKFGRGCAEKHVISPRNIKLRRASKVLRTRFRVVPARQRIGWKAWTFECKCVRLTHYVIRQMSI